MAEDTLHLLLETDDERGRTRRREALFISVIAHLLVIIVILVEPKFLKDMKTALAPPPRPRRQLTYLTVPSETTRPPTETAKPKASVPFDRERLSRSIPSPPKLPPLPPPERPAEREKKPEEGRQLASALPPRDLSGQIPEAPKISDVPTQQPPKLTLPTSGSPASALEESLRGLARQRAGGGGGTVIEQPAGRLDPRNPAVLGQAQILSDTQGVNFNPYLQRILIDIRRNWYAVMPEIARLGKRGRVILQFEIQKDGAVPHIYLVASSASDPLDRAALAGISASVPFTPLPAEFHGNMIRLQIMFLYNLSLDY